MPLLLMLWCNVVKRNWIIILMHTVLIHVLAVFWAKNSKVINSQSAINTHYAAHSYTYINSCGFCTQAVNAKANRLKTML